MLLVIWTVVLAAALTLFFRRKYSLFSDYGVKHDKPIPLLGNMGKLIFQKQAISDVMDALYKEHRDERFFGRYEFTKPTIVIKDIDLIRKVAFKDFEHFLDHRNFLDEKSEPMFTRNLFSLRGDEWKDMRSTLSPAFTSSKMKLMVPLMEEVGENMIKSLYKLMKESKTGAVEVDIRDLLSRYTNDVIASCAFGLKVDSHTERENRFYQEGNTATSALFKQSLLFFLGSCFPDLVKKLKLKLFSESSKSFFFNIITKTMEDREARKIYRPDMVQILMQIKKGQLAHDENYVRENQQDAGFATVEESAVGRKTINRDWSEMDLVAQAVLFFIAGFDTVSTAMSFALHELALHPDVQERLVKELKEHSIQRGGKLDFNSIQNLQYLDMVVSEALRLWPPVFALDRVCVKDYNLGKPNPLAKKDYIVRKGDTIAIPAWSFHRDPQYYPNPLKFDPERFSPDNKHKINPMTYMPFGLGPRNCIGSRFALCEIKVMLYQILLKTEVCKSDKTILPEKLTNYHFSPRIVGGQWVKFKPRI